MLFDATRIAADAHDGQFRKGTRVPYLVHPLRVAAIVSHAGLGDTVVAAAILHDTVEDTSVTIDDLRRRFPQRVCDLVLSATEPDKSAPWEARKTQAIGHVADLPPDALCLLCADKIDNLQSLHENLVAEGEATWTRFSRGRDLQRWYHTEMLAAVRAAAAHFNDGGPGATPEHTAESVGGAGRTAAALTRLVARLSRAVAEVFPEEVR